VSTRSDGTLQLNSGQILSGNGTLRGSVNVSGTLAPGGDTLGTLTVTNVVNLLNAAVMKLNRGTAPGSDRLIAPNINLNGTLMVTNVGPALHVGDTFTLFNGTLAGAFGSVILPNYYTWDISQLTVNGTITVTGAALPSFTPDFTAFHTSGTITFNGSNGIPNNGFSVLSTTNLTLPLGSWTNVASGNFDGFGNYSVPVIVDPTVPTQFFIFNAQ
jgi:hypothetical protein